MSRRLKLLGVSAMLSLTTIGLLVAYAAQKPAADVFCEAYGIAGVSGTRYGDLVIVDWSIAPRDTCGDDDLWHFDFAELAMSDRRMGLMSCYSSLGPR